MEYEIYIPQPQADALLAEAADRGTSVEELLTEIIQNYIKKDAIPCGTASISHIQLALYLSISRRIL